jgi:isopentenyl-diphosphate delta-isomerase
MDRTEVILVDEKDQPCGLMEKMEAHQKGVLHRAFSVFIFNKQGEMLLQQRATEKYHSGGLWTNACCSHPLPGENTSSAAVRRLKEEMGFDTSLEKIFDFLYKARFDNGLTEHEFDHVYAGEYEGDINFDTSEVKDVCFKSMKEIKEDLERQPEKFTTWFRIAFPQVEQWWWKMYEEQT